MTSSSWHRCVQPWPLTSLLSLNPASLSVCLLLCSMTFPVFLTNTLNICNLKTSSFVEADWTLFQKPEQVQNRCSQPFITHRPLLIVRIPRATFPNKWLKSGFHHTGNSASPSTLMNPINIMHWKLVTLQQAFTSTPDPRLWQMLANVLASATTSGRR